MLVATGRAANVEEIGLETTKVEVERGVIKVNGRMRTREPHVYAIGDVDRRTVARPHGGPRGDRRRPHDRRREGCPRDRLRRAAPGDVLPARDRVGRPDRGPVPGARPALQGGQGALPGDRQGAHRRRVRRLCQGHRQHRDRRHARRPHRRTARHRPDRRGVARRSHSRRRPGRSGRPPIPIRRCPRSSARRPSPSTAGRSTSDHVLTTEAAMTATGHRAKTPSDLGADVGLDDEQLLAMYRMVALARAVDERMWILEPGRPDPVRDQRPGPRGCPGRGDLGPAQGPRLDRPVLPLDRDVHDLRHERPGHHAGPVRPGQRPVVGRPPDARPLRRSPAQPAVGLVAGRDPDPARRRDRPGGQDPAAPARWP